jgi:hypothetical protein
MDDITSSDRGVLDFDEIQDMKLFPLIKQEVIESVNEREIVSLKRTKKILFAMGNVQIRNCLIC